MQNKTPSAQGLILDEINQTLSALDEKQLLEVVMTIQPFTRVFVTGAGRSLLMMRAFAMRLMHLGKTAFVVGDTTTPAIQADDLLVVGSGSGETGNLIHQVNKAKKIGVTVLLVTSKPVSTLAGLADQVLLIPAVSQQPGGSLFEQSLLLTLDNLVLRLFDACGVSFDSLAQLHANLE